MKKESYPREDSPLLPRTCKDLRPESEQQKLRVEGNHSASNDIHGMWNQRTKTKEEAQITLSSVTGLGQLGNLDGVQLLGCEHIFHSSCIAACYLAQRDTCPVCAPDVAHYRPTLQETPQACL